MNVQICSTQQVICERQFGTKLAARCAQEAVASSPSATPLDLGTQVQTLQQMVNQLQEERDALAKEVQSGPLERPKVRQRLSVRDPTQTTLHELDSANLNGAHVASTWRLNCLASVFATDLLHVVLVAMLPEFSTPRITRVFQN